jgi:hypothetical protein
VLHRVQKPKIAVPFPKRNILPTIIEVQYKEKAFYTKENCKKVLENLNYSMDFFSFTHINVILGLYMIICFGNRLFHSTFS